MLDQFNLDAPPNFRGLNPDLPIEVYERTLPHWRQQGATYFVTFRLADSLPKEKLLLLQRVREEWNRTHPQSSSQEERLRFSSEIQELEDRYLDEGHGACILGEPRLARAVEDVLLHFQNQRYFISAWTIMPNHCHLTIKPFAGWPLEKLLQGIKGFSAFRLNQLLATHGAIWQDESYDQIIRDEEHLWNILQYIGRNAQVAGIDQNRWHRWVDPSWIAAGWNFFDA